MINTLKELLDRDLDKLKKEIELYEKEELMWVVEGTVNNSAGNLVLHLCGNLQHFIGAVLGDTGFKRDRDAEFAKKGVSREKLIRKIEETRLTVETTLDNLNELDLETIYPINVLRENMTTEFFLTHLATHLTYHLGQVSYHRRLVT